MANGTATATRHCPLTLNQPCQITCARHGRFGIRLANSNLPDWCRYALVLVAAAAQHDNDAEHHQLEIASE